MVIQQQKKFVKIKILKALSTIVNQKDLWADEFRLYFRELISCTKEIKWSYYRNLMNVPKEPSDLTYLCIVLKEPSDCTKGT